MLSAVLALTIAAVLQTHTVRGVVLDPQGLPVPRASVRIACGDWFVDTNTADDGRFSADVAGDSCAVSVNAAGFEESASEFDAGRSTPVVVRLSLRSVKENVAVSAPASLASLTLEREAMWSIGPDADDVLRYALARVGLSGRSAAIYVDGLRATVLPSIDMMESLRVNTSPFSAEYGDGDVVRIDIVPRGVSRKWRLRPNGSLLGFGGGDRLQPDGRAVARSGSVGFGGPILALPMSFSGDVTRSHSERELAVVAPPLPSSVSDSADAGDQPPTASSRTTGLSLAGSYNARAGSRVFASGSQISSEATNVGAGGIVLPAAGLHARTTSRTMQASVSAVRARVISESGMSIQSSSTGTAANTTGPGLSVPGLFVDGGAPISEQHTAFTSLTLRQVFRKATGLPFTAGATVTEIRQHVAAVPNPAGTFVFDDLNGLEAGRDGMPTGSRTQVRTSTGYGVTDRLIAAFVQVPFWRAPGVEASGGIRLDHQARTPLAVSPRLAATIRHGKLRLEAGAGLFAKPIPTSVFLVERASAAGAMPYVGHAGLSTIDSTLDEAPVHTVLANDIHEARQTLIRTSAERPFGRLDLGVEYTWSSDAGRLGSSRVWADGGWIDAIAPGQAARSDTVVTRARYAWGHQSLTASHIFVRSRDNGEGPFFYHPAAMEGEWAATAGIAPHTFVMTGNFLLPGRLTVVAIGTVQSSAPTDVSSGRDDNGDGLFIERGDAPRNSGVLPSQQSSSLHVSRSLTLPRSSWSPGLRLGLGAHVDNLLNARNVVNVGTVVQAPTFGRTLRALPGRTIRFTVSVY